MITADEFADHSSCTFTGVEIAAGRAKPGMAAKRDKFKKPAVSAGIHSSTKSGITAINHLVDIFNLDRTRMAGIKDFFIMISKDSL